ncbi:MAG: hypothetical protein M1837_002276 [Sclerophora amabilis]|nr:MAG: hypothetical protein M1837_002276 [Sclerophora amabilis]
MLRILLAAGLSIGQALSFNCSIDPIYVDIHYRRVHDVEVEAWGSFVGLGTATQNLSLPISLSHNETSVADAGFCKDSGLRDCETSTGGFFEPSLSKTWKAADDYRSKDDDEQSPEERSYGTDTFYLYTHFFQTDPAFQTHVDDFPVQVATSGDANPAWLGMGHSSTLLDRLYSEGLISSRSFSYYVGTAEPRAGGDVNGSITFGGYDASRFTGPVHNYTMDGATSNPFQVHVSDIVINGVDGASNNVSLLDTDKFSNLSDDEASGFDAEISTDQWPLSLPYEITQNFLSALSAEPSDAPDGSLRLKKPFNGTISIVLSDGFSITLPSEVVYSQSRLSPVVDRSKDSSEPFRLSSAWLSQVYLMVDYDADAFHLAQAVPEAPFISTRTTCPKTVPAPYERPARKPFSRVGLTGAIVGGVVGFMALCTGIFCLVSMLRRKRRAEQSTPLQLEEGKKGVRITQFEMSDKDSGSAASSVKDQGAPWSPRDFLRR